MKRHSIGTIASMLLFLIPACASNKFNSKYFDDIEKYIKEEFISEHEVNLSTKPNDKPKQIIIPVGDIETYNTVFKDDYRIDVDFDKQMIFVCSFFSIYRKEHYLEAVRLADENLVIECTHEKCAGGTGCVCAPYQRWCAIRMDIVEYSDISFVGE